MFSITLIAEISRETRKKSHSMSITKPPKASENQKGPQRLEKTHLRNPRFRRGVREAARGEEK
jgi:hypothetical protein